MSELNEEPTPSHAPMRFLPLAVTLLALAGFFGWIYWIDSEEARVSRQLEYTIQLDNCTEHDTNCTNLRMVVTNPTDQLAELDYTDVGGGPSGGRNNIKIYGNDTTSCDGVPIWDDIDDDTIPAKKTRTALLECEYPSDPATERPQIVKPTHVTIYGRYYEITQR